MVINRGFTANLMVNELKLATLYDFEVLQI